VTADDRNCPPRHGTHVARVRWSASRLTAPEAVGRQYAWLRGRGADLALGPRLVREVLTFLMRTTGTSLLAVKRRSPVHMPIRAQDSRSAHGLLWLAAVRDGCKRQPEANLKLAARGRAAAEASHPKQP
jgi:hypothetical protein